MACAALGGDRHPARGVAAHAKLRPPPGAGAGSGRVCGAPGWAAALPALPGQATWRPPRRGRGTRQPPRGAALAAREPAGAAGDRAATRSSTHAAETVTTLLDRRGRRRVGGRAAGAPDGPDVAEGPPASCFWLPGCREGPLAWLNLNPWSRGHREASAGHLRTGRSRWCSRSTGRRGTGPAPPHTRPHLQDRAPAGEPAASRPETTAPGLARAGSGRSTGRVLPVVLRGLYLNRWG